MLYIMTKTWSALRLVLDGWNSNALFSMPLRMKSEEGGVLTASVPVVGVLPSSLPKDLDLAMQRLFWSGGPWLCQLHPSSWCLQSVPARDAPT